ncbi:MAG: GTPase ObgE [Candidatus Brocadiia bacterium]
MFIDEATVYVRAGRGGDGCVSFRREKFVPRGGPDGGDGGKGGDVVLVADPSVDTLYDFTYRRHLVAKAGKGGQGKNKTGASAPDLVVPVPVGTLVYDVDKSLLLRDLSKQGERVCVARGGAGGRGNKHFATATHQTPREAEEGQPGEERTLRLELKLLADVGLVGLPNAGKSTLISRISHAHPRVAPYPFTTRQPCLGIVDMGDFRRLVVADIPGLIEGAHEGHGLGIEFLRHIERTRVLLHVVDAAGVDGTPPLEAYRVLRDELASYGHALLDRPALVAANKVDLPEGREAVRALEADLPVRVLPISAATGEGIPALLAALVELVDRAGE